ncbi:hypothetical protein BSKO_00946 [Bryopsis sp. KO-2023]|nr:hypothetical protein BSKO_00946 [Bryopsis sp. KO-2023]
MRGGINIKSCPEASDMGQDKAAELGVTPRVASFGHQGTYAGLNLGAQIDEKDARIDIEEAMRAVDMALAGLDLGPKRQSAPNPPPKQPDLARRSHDARTSGGRPAKTGPKVPRRHSAHVTQKAWEDQQLLVQDALQALRQQNVCLPYQEQSFVGNSSTNRFKKGQDSLSSMGSNSQFSGLFTPTGFNSGSEGGKTGFNQPELLSSPWGSRLGGGGSATNGGGGGSPPGGWNMQYVQNVLGQQQAPQQQPPTQHQQTQQQQQANITGSFGMTSTYDNMQSAASKYNSILTQGNLDLLFNSGDSFNSQVMLESCKMEPTPSAVNSFFPAGSALDSAMNLHLPEILEQESAAKHQTPSWKVLPDIKPGIHMEPKTKSEQALLLAIAGILKCALEGNLGQKDLKSDLNFLIVSVRRHLHDYQNLSTEGAETLLLIASTLPTVCRTANFGTDVVSSLRRFMKVISSGHPLLQSHASCLGDYNPKAPVEAKQQSEVRHLLTRIHRKLTGGSTSNGVQHVALALFESSGDIRCSPATNSTADMESRESSPKSFAFSLLNTRTTQGSLSPRCHYHDDDDDVASCASGFSFISCDDVKPGIMSDDMACALDSARECNKHL